MVKRGVWASGTEGYAEIADALAAQYESIGFAEVHPHLTELLPKQPSRVLDIGAGTGRDAAALAAMGHSVVAAEPTTELRERGRRLHVDRAIEWIDDSLPELALVRTRGDRFEVVLLTAVWMHLDEAQRAAAMPRVAALMASGGLLSLTLRHGPVPAGRRMFEVSAEETCRLAEAAGLDLVQRRERGDMLGRSAVSWTGLAFHRPVTLSEAKIIGDL